VDENASHNLCQGYGKIESQVDLKELTFKVEKKSKRLNKNRKKNMDNNFEIISRKLQKK